MIKTININPSLTKKQKAALKLLFDYKNGVTEILYGGAAGGGKSHLGCLWLILCSLKYPESRWLMGRSKLNTLKQTTLKTFFEVAKSLNLKEDEHYTYNQMNNQIKFSNGSEIILKDLFLYPSDPEFDSLGSLEIAGAFIDECNQVSLKAKNIVMSRIRHKLDTFNITPKLLMTCNPARNWVYNEFYKKAMDNTLEEYKRFIPALNTDNPYISKHYITGLQRQDELTKSRLLFGNWEYSDDLALFNYDNIINLFELPIQSNQPDSDKPNSEVYMTIDVARLGKDKTIIMVWDGLDVVYIDEIGKTRLDDQANIIKDLMKKYGVKNESIIIDTDGVGGGLADILRGCTEIINNSKALNGENYQNLKTQLYYKLAEKINNDEIKIFSINEEQKLKLTQELQVIKREDADQDGKIKMTSKDKIKALIGRSPDISDALAFRMIKEIGNKKKFNYLISF